MLLPIFRYIGRTSAVLEGVTHKSTVARTVICRQDGRGRFPFFFFGQTYKENPNLVRILYMVCTLNDIYKQYNKLHVHKNQFTSLCRGQKPASKCIRLVYEILVICRALLALYTPQRCELMKTKTNNTNCSYRIFIVCRSPVSPVFWGRVRLSINFLPKQSLCTLISR